MGKYNGKMIVITGAAGFIGSGVVRYLNDQGIHNLLLIDDIGHSQKWKNLVSKRFLSFIPIKDTFNYLQGKEKDIFGFIHLGANSDTLETNVDHLLENNYRYSINLADFAIKNGHRFIYASSAATYGDGGEGFCDDHELIYRLKPLNAYGYSKQLVDMWFLERGLLNKVTGLKYFNVFGPNEDHKGRMASMVYKMVPKIKQEGFVSLYKSTEPEKYADGGQLRDFIYVKDAARMTCEFLDNDLTGIYNIGNGIATSWNELADAIFYALNKPFKVEYINMPAELARQYQNYTCADMQKYTNAYNLKKDSFIEYPVRSAVVDYVDYLLRDTRW